MGTRRPDASTEFSFTWKQLSVIAGVTWTQFYFRLYPGTIRGPQAREFLAHLRRQIRGPLLVIWDGLAVHRSKIVRQWVDRSDGELVLAHLPTQVPEVNPVEYVWGNIRYHALGDFCPANLWELSAEACHALRRSQRCQTLVRAFCEQAELSL